MAIETVTPVSESETQQKMNALAFEIFYEEREQLCAILSSIERELGELCNQGNNPPDDAPLQAWRLAQVGKDKLGSTSIENSIKVLLGLAREEVFHV